MQISCQIPKPAILAVLQKIGSSDYSANKAFCFRYSEGVRP